MRSLYQAVAFLTLGCAAAAQSPWTIQFGNRYSVQPNITYVVANNYEAKLDLYERRDVTDAQPTLIYIHGGGWVGGTKEGGVGFVMPWLEMGWNVVNVEYRLARVSLAPAAVEDCLCVLRWIATNAKQHHIDLNRLVVTGDSAGGHLALTTGMIPESAGLDRGCPGAPLPKIAAIVDWYGITDVGDLLDGANRKTYAVAWLGSLSDREQIAKRISPLTFVRAGLPPILMIHGDADPTVPYAHSVRLHEALDRAAVPNQLFTVPGGKHGHFTDAQYSEIYPVIRAFLAKHGITDTVPR